MQHRLRRALRPAGASQTVSAARERAGSDDAAGGALWATTALRVGARLEFGIKPYQDGEWAHDVCTLDMGYRRAGGERGGVRFRHSAAAVNDDPGSGVALRIQRNNGIVRSASGPGQIMLWEIER
jgi:hypothetical protein